MPLYKVEQKPDGRNGHGKSRDKGGGKRGRLRGGERFADAARKRQNFAPFMRDAPSIAGIAIKNENSAAAVRDIPRQQAPSTVEPERDVPGIIASA